MHYRRIVTRALLLALGAGLAVSACATEPVGYNPYYYGYYDYYPDGGVVFVPGHGHFHGHHGFGHHGGFVHGGFGGHGFGGHHGGGFAGHGGVGAHGGAGGHGGGAVGGGGHGGVGGHGGR